MNNEYFNKHFVQNKGCNRCGYPVLKSDLNSYSYQCAVCDEDLFEFETQESNTKISDIELQNLIKYMGQEIEG